MRNPSRPRKHAWFVIVLGLLTIAHMWSHAVQVSDHVAADTLMAASHSGPDHDGHGEQTHSHPFTTSSLTAAPTGQGEWTAVTVLPADAEPDLAPLPMGRAPPGDHRGRAALTQTLEVRRC
ncbi:hypothetical protein ACFLIM_33070 [Nonomuraea sp. M3C6]|uniref:Secreted protein n=1 Tax=Nonomuraea marmarensis TaxID=3351344 RepID=A0ABW7APB9_9ACTN